MLRQKDLKEWLDYDPDTGLFHWKIVSGKARVGSIAGSPHIKGYLTIGILRKHFLAHRLAWLFVYGEWPDKQIDHINGIKNDNRIINLRLATNVQNHANKGLQRNNKTGYKGLCWIPRVKMWRVKIVVNKQRIELGYFSNKDEAISARLNAERVYQNEFAWNYEKRI